MKKTLIILVVIIILAVVGFFIVNMSSTEQVENTDEVTTEDEMNDEEEVQEPTGPMSVIGKSVEGRDIEAYTYGDGDTHLVFVGGIHGGYSWNTALVAQNLVEYLENNPSEIPANEKITVIPVLNPDGLYKVAGKVNGLSASDITASKEETEAGRFNANDVDLNRNFDCDWQSEGTWQSRTVSGGSSAFSEPESQAIKNFVEENNPDAVVVWYSAVGGVFASNCHNGVLSETKEILNAFADASGYKAYEEFNFYEITGDMTNWLASIEIPSFSILLTTHDSIEWDKNLKGVKALISHYKEEAPEESENEN